MACCASSACAKERGEHPDIVPGEWNSVGEEIRFGQSPGFAVIYITKKSLAHRIAITTLRGHMSRSTYLLKK